MKRQTVDPDGYGPNDIVDRLHRCIDSGIYGMDYVISARDKNEELLSKYAISEKDRIDILRKLTVDNYVGWDMSDDPKFPKDVVHFFSFNTKLFPRGIEEADLVSVKLYIKLTWTKAGNILIVISFHD